MSDNTIILITSIDHIPNYILDSYHIIRN